MQLSAEEKNDKKLWMNFQNYRQYFALLKLRGSAFKTSVKLCYWGNKTQKLHMALLQALKCLRLVSTLMLSAMW